MAPGAALGAVARPLRTVSGDRLPVHGTSDLSTVIEALGENTGVQHTWQVIDTLSNGWEVVVGLDLMRLLQFTVDTVRRVPMRLAQEEPVAAATVVGGLVAATRETWHTVAAVEVEEAETAAGGALSADYLAEHPAFEGPPTLRASGAVPEQPPVEAMLRGSTLEPAEQERLGALVLEYSDIFAESLQAPWVLNPSHGVYHVIPTGTAAPIRLAPYRVSAAERDVLRDLVTDMEAAGIVRPSSSPWAAPVVLVRRKNGAYRFCVDYRRLNAVTVKDAFPMALVEDLLDALSGADTFTSLDLSSGYWQIPVAPDDIPKTAFVTPFGLYEFVVMPFGLTSAPATFQRLMNAVLRSLPERAYLDDIAVGSAVGEHAHRLRALFEVLRKAGLRLKASKCHLGQPSIKFLGHVVSRDGLAVDLEKTRAIDEWPRPRNTTDVRRFLGLASYYRRFVYQFATLAEPLTQLTGKDTAFEWTAAHETAFQELKTALVTTPVLGLPVAGRPFQLITDASTVGISAILVQPHPGEAPGAEPVVAYASRVLLPAERRYSATELECLAVVWGLEKFRTYIWGQPVKVITDHHALSWLWSLKDPTGRLGRWALRLQEFDITVVYRPGRLNGSADALSREPLGARGPSDADEHGAGGGGAVDADVTAAVSTDAAPAPLDPDELRDAQTRDAVLGPLRTYLLEGTLPAAPDVATRVVATAAALEVDEHGRVVLRASARLGQPERLYVPSELRPALLAAHHDGRLGGHLSAAKTISRLESHYYWPSLRVDARSYTASCVPCQTRKTPRVPAAGQLVPMPIVAPWERVAVDVLGPLPATERGNRYIVVFADACTKWVEAFPTQRQDADTLARLLWDEIVCRYGAPARLLSDQGPAFESQLFQAVAREAGIDKIRTSAYHPQTDGQVERFNHTLEAMLSMFVNRDQSDWDRHLPAVLYAYRTATHASTGEAPFRLLFGRTPLGPLEVALRAPRDEPDLPMVAELRATLDEALKDAHEHQHAAQARNARSYNARRRPITLEVGTRVWLHHPERRKGKSPKLAHPWRGPFTVVRAVGLNNYQLKGENGVVLHDLVHVARLKTAQLPPGQADPPNSSPTSGGDDSDSDSDDDTPARRTTTGEAMADDEFEVDRILAERTVGNQRQYLVRWLGYGPESDSWEPARNISPGLVRSFKAVSQ